jgi:hypothetical protein
MREQLRFVPARVEFDPTLANELARSPAPASTVDGNIFLQSGKYQIKQRFLFYRGMEQPGSSSGS